MQVRKENIAHMLGNVERILTIYTFGPNVVVTTNQRVIHATIESDPDRLKHVADVKYEDIQDVHIKKGKKFPGIHVHDILHIETTSPITVQPIPFEDRESLASLVREIGELTVK